MLIMKLNVNQIFHYFFIEFRYFGGNIRHYFSNFEQAKVAEELSLNSLIMFVCHPRIRFPASNLGIMRGFKKLSE